jgi:hypothetical protein
MSYMGRAAHWNDMSRGAQHWIQGADAAAEAIGLKGAKWPGAERLFLSAKVGQQPSALSAHWYEPS